MTTIKRLPDGVFILGVSPKEIDEVRRKLDRQEDLTDREITITREFEL